VILPRLLVLTDRTQCAGSLPDTVAAAVDAGARAIVLREKDLPDAERGRLAERLGALLAAVGGVLIRAGYPGSEGARAVHLAAADPFPQARPELVGRSCHSRAELGRSAAEGCDYATISPVFATASKPGYGPALGLEGLAAVAGAGPPAYALAGIAPDAVRGCRVAGAYGIAVMGAVMREPGLVRRYLAELELAELEEPPA
jgi:thiamine-phosphate diphosphorylase